MSHISAIFIKSLREVISPIAQLEGLIEVTVQGSHDQASHLPTLNPVFAVFDLLVNEPRILLLTWLNHAVIVLVPP